MDFLRFSIKALLFEIRFYTEVPGSFQSITSMPLVHRKAPGKIETQAIRPLAMGRRQLRPISDEPTAGSVGEVVGEVCKLT
jgi:hypothetical protein